MRGASPVTEYPSSVAGSNRWKRARRSSPSWTETGLSAIASCATTTAEHGDQVAEQGYRRASANIYRHGREAQVVILLCLSSHVFYARSH